MFNNINARRRKVADAPAPGGESGFSFNFAVEGESNKSESTFQAALSAASTPSFNDSSSWKPIIRPLRQISSDRLVFAPDSELPGNFLDFTSPGVHVYFAPTFPPKIPKAAKKGAKKVVKTVPVPTDDLPALPCSWIIEMDQLSPQEAGSNSDICVDPQSHLVSVYNNEATPKSIYLSIREPYFCFTDDFAMFPSAINMKDTERCLTTTFSLVVPARSVVDLCFLYKMQYPELNTQSIPMYAIYAPELTDFEPEKELNLDDLQNYLFSHITTLNSCPKTFPLLCDASSANANNNIAERILHESALLWNKVVPVFAAPLLGGPYLISQGFAGVFTHFLKQTKHAIDISCPIGTPVLACSDAEVVSVHCNSTCSGPHAENLFSWNSVMLKVSPQNIAFAGEEALTPQSLYIEYVHLQSINVKVGQAVKRGQVIALSGAAGFAPHPHLHIQVQASNRKDALTIPFAFEQQTGAVIPAAGQFVYADGVMSKAKASQIIDLANFISNTIAGKTEQEMEEEEIYATNAQFPYSVAALVAEYCIE